MTKESSFQIFPIYLFLKEAYPAVRFYINITGCVGMTVSCFETIFIVTLKENIAL